MGADRARTVRAFRASYLARVQAGRLQPADAILRPPEPLQGLEIYYLLMACPGLGRAKVRAVFERSKVWPHLTLAEMTNSERRAVIECLPNGD